MTAVIRRLLFIPASVLYVVCLIPLFLLAIPTWVVTGNGLEDQLDWYLDRGEKLLDWVNPEG